MGVWVAPSSDTPSPRGFRFFSPKTFFVRGVSRLFFVQGGGVWVVLPTRPLIYFPSTTGRRRGATSARTPPRPPRAPRSSPRGRTSRARTCTCSRTRGCAAGWRSRAPRRFISTTSCDDVRHIRIGSLHNSRVANNRHRAPPQFPDANHNQFNAKYLTMCVAFLSIFGLGGGTVKARARGGAASEPPTAVTLLARARGRRSSAGGVLRAAGPFQVAVKQPRILEVVVGRASRARRAARRQRRCLSRLTRAPRCSSPTVVVGRLARVRRAARRAVRDRRWRSSASSATVVVATAPPMTTTIAPTTRTTSRTRTRARTATPRRRRCSAAATTTRTRTPAAAATTSSTTTGARARRRRRRRGIVSSVVCAVCPPPPTARLSNGVATATAVGQPASNVLSSCPSSLHTESSRSRDVTAF